jgi:hypothetical protein
MPMVSTRFEVCSFVPSHGKNRIRESLCAVCVSEGSDNEYDGYHAVTIDHAIDNQTLHAAIAGRIHFASAEMLPQGEYTGAPIRPTVKDTPVRDQRSSIRKPGELRLMHIIQVCTCFCC